MSFMSFKNQQALGLQILTCFYAMTGVCMLPLTYPHELWVISKPLQPTENSVSVLFPFSLAEDYLQKVPGPAYQRDLQKLVFGQDFGALIIRERISQDRKQKHQCHAMF